MDRTSANTPTLQVFEDGEIVFERNGKWLYPLFELEDFLQDHPINLSRANLRDKVIGKAAAILALRLGFQRLHGDLMSDLAIALLESKSVAYSFDVRVPQIDCQTEELLKRVNNLDKAYRILCQRANRC